MISDEIGNNILFTQGKTNEMIGTQQIITMFIMIHRIDEMTNIMQ